MYKIVIIVSWIISLLAFQNLFCQNLKPDQTKSTFKYTLFNSQADVDFAFYERKYKPNTLSKEQLRVAELIIKKVSDSLDFLLTSTNVNTGIVDTLKYVFQIVSARNNSGHLFLWVNAICGPNKNWRKNIVIVEDGGSCYYRFKINLDTKQYFDIQINSNG